MKFKFRAFISLCTTFLFLAATITGLFMFVMPDPSVAYWNNWQFLGLDKIDWEGLHGIVSTYWSIFLLVHLILNWKLFTSYLKRKKNKITKKSRIGKELLIAIVVSGLLIVGSAIDSPLQKVAVPFEALQGVWYSENHNPPIEDLQAIPLKFVIKIYDLNINEVESKLKGLNIDMIDMDLSLEEYCEIYNISPREMFNVMQ